MRIRLSKDIVRVFSILRFFKRLVIKSFLSLMLAALNYCINNVSFTGFFMR